HFTGPKTSLDEETLHRVRDPLLALAEEPSEADVLLDFGNVGTSPARRWGRWSPCTRSWPPGGRQLTRCNHDWSAGPNPHRPARNPGDGSTGGSHSVPATRAGPRRSPVRPWAGPDPQGARAHVLRQATRAAGGLAGDGAPDPGQRNPGVLNPAR